MWTRATAWARSGMPAGRRNAKTWRANEQERRIDGEKGNVAASLLGDGECGSNEGAAACKSRGECAYARPL